MAALVVVEVLPLVRRVMVAGLLLLERLEVQVHPLEDQEAILLQGPLAIQAPWAIPLDRLPLHWLPPRRQVKGPSSGLFQLFLVLTQLVQIRTSWHLNRQEQVSLPRCLLIS